MVELNWEEINKKLQGVSFSVIGCTFPEDIDENVKETLDTVFKRIYLEPRSEKFIKITSLIGEGISDNNLQLTDEQMSILENVLTNNTNDEIISRVGDALWILKKDFQAARKAIQAHRNLFEQNKELDNFKRNQALINALIAFNLMMQLGQKEEAINMITDTIDHGIKENEEFFCDSFLAHIVQTNKFKLLSDNKKTMYKKYLKEKARDYGSSEAAGNLLVQIAQKENDIQAQKEAYVLIAAGWEKIGELPNSAGIQRATSLSKAADNYKKGGNEVAANRCIIAAQKNMKNQSEWIRRSYPIDLKPIVDICEPQFSNAINISEKIILITEFTKIKSEDIFQQHYNNKSENAFYGVFNEQSIDEKGIVRSNKEGIDPNDEHSEEPYLMKVAAQYIGFHAQLIHIFNKKYVLSEADQVTFSEIIKPLLPENVQMIDYILHMVLSNHPEIVIESLLVVFESFLAALLEMNNISSIKQMDDGNVQEDLTMGTLVNECKKHELIDKDDILMIEALLCNKHGLNLRNTSSHRLTPDAQRVSTVYLFCGYFLIRLLMQYGSGSEKLSKDDQEK